MREDRVNVGESCTLARGSKIRASSFRGKGGQARKAFLEQVEGSMIG